MRHTISVLLVIACVSPIAGAQTPAKEPAFEVATVKPSGRDSPPMSIQLLPGGRLVTANTSLTMLINWAFSLDDGRLFGAPKGADSARFDVVAKMPENIAGRGQVQLMMRALLAERFKLAVHRETRELTSYALVTDEGGPKIKVFAQTELPDANPFRMSAAGMMTGTRVTTDMLATVLSSQLGRPVENRTGITGAFDFTLNWRPDERSAVDDDRASLSTAIREQLGLRLLAQKAAVDVIVIDHVETTPIDN
jgi:uncharacterized protein (TIGR03435 family)